MIRATSILLFLITLLLSCRIIDKTKDKPLSEAIRKQYSIKGDSLIKLTFDTLRSALEHHLNEKGVEGAIEYCNINAYVITTLHAKNGIMIRRAAVKYRNPGNAPDSLEKKVFERFESFLKNKQPLESVILEKGSNIHYFKPIILQSMCRNCHGSIGTDIKPEAIEAIKRRYPTDMATGFSEGDLRGIWHVLFPDDFISH